MANLLRATNLRGYGELVRSLGGDPDTLLRRHLIAPGAVDQEDAFVPFAAVAALLEDSAHTLACPDFALRLSTWQGLDILGPVAVIARNSATVRDAFASIARFLFVHSPALHLHEIEDGDRGLVYHFEVDEPRAPALAQAYELSLANGIRILRMLAGEGSRPTRVAFRHPRQGPPESYHAAFGAPVLFEQSWCGLEVDLDLASQPLSGADPATREIATRYLEAQFGAQHDTFAVRVAELVRRLLPTGHADASTVADQLRLHPRTLQRRLTGEGVTFAALLERERQAQAARLLTQPDLQLGQVAALLGYSEQSAFNRAFRRWYGVPPGRYRPPRHED
jgi:AraC-like DNA-binding protein